MIHISLTQPITEYEYSVLKDIVPEKQVKKDILRLEYLLQETLPGTPVGRAIFSVPNEILVYRFK